MWVQKWQEGQKEVSLDHQTYRHQWNPSEMKPVSLVHYGDIGLSANLDQAMSKKKKKKGKGKGKNNENTCKNTHSSIGLTRGPNWQNFAFGRNFW